jgi:hypothetical protein
MHGSQTFEDYFEELNDFTETRCTLLSVKPWRRTTKIHEVGFDFDGLAERWSIYAHSVA